MPQQPSHPGLQARHDAQGGGGLEGVPELGIVSKWRQKERLKTTAVALVLCLNIGVDPPGRHQNLAMRSPGVLGRSAVNAAPQGSRNDRYAATRTSM